jgi:HK97 family phage portal protein
MDPLALATRAARAVATNVLTATDGRDVLLNSPDGWEVEQPWLWWTGPAGSNGAGGGPFGNPIPGAEPWGLWAGIPAVARATSLIVDTLAALPWRVMRGTEQLPTPDWISDPQALRMDGRIVDESQLADARWSWMDFWTQWITSALWFGDGYIYVPARDSFNAPRPPLYVLHPDDVRIENGVYSVADVELSPQSLIHLRGEGPVVKGHGLGVLERFARTLGYTSTLRDYAGNVFYNGVPAGYLKVTKEGLAQDKADLLKERWLAAHGGSRKSIAVLNSTTEFHPLTMTPVDTALIEAMAENLNEIANAFGIPGYMIGSTTDTNTYANIESRRTDLVTFTYLPWAARIEAVLDAQLPRGTSVKVALDALARADTATRYATYKIALDAGILTVDEVRALEDRPPLAEDEVMVG